MHTFRHVYLMEGTANEQKRRDVHTLQRRENAFANPVGGNAQKKPTVWGREGMIVISTGSDKSREASKPQIASALIQRHPRQGGRHGE